MIKQSVIIGSCMINFAFDIPLLNYSNCMMDSSLH